MTEEDRSRWFLSGKGLGACQEPSRGQEVGQEDQAEVKFGRGRRWTEGFSGRSEGLGGSSRPMLHLPEATNTMQTVYEPHYDQPGLGFREFLSTQVRENGPAYGPPRHGQWENTSASHPVFKTDVIDTLLETYTTQEPTQAANGQMYAHPVRTPVRTPVRQSNNWPPVDNWPSSSSSRPDDSDHSEDEIISESIAEEQARRIVSELLTKGLESDQFYNALIDEAKEFARHIRRKLRERKRQTREQRTREASSNNPSIKSSRISKRTSNADSAAGKRIEMRTYTEVLRAYLYLLSTEPELVLSEWTGFS